MPNLWSAVVILLLRASISQMDVPVRQSYTMEVVAPDERSAASGITTVARSDEMANPLLFSAPFFVVGGLKIAYDLMLYKALFKFLAINYGILWQRSSSMQTPTWLQSRISSVIPG